MSIAPEILELCARASGDAYQVLERQESIPELGINVSKVIQDASGQVRGFIGTHVRGLIISIKGTATLQDFMVDGDFLKRPFHGTMVHEGFLEEHDLVLRRLPLIGGGRPVFVVGHSLGGAVASLLGVTLKLRFQDLDVAVITFGSPRVGDGAFADLFNRTVERSVRIVHKFDLVPRIPKIDYRHVTGLLRLDSDGRELGMISNFLWEIGHLGEVLLSDLDGEALEDHHIDSYIQAVSRYAKRSLGEKLTA